MPYYDNVMKGTPIKAENSRVKVAQDWGCNGLYVAAEGFQQFAASNEWVLRQLRPAGSELRMPTRNSRGLLRAK
jgi:hypothetical protein